MNNCLIEGVNGPDSSGSPEGGTTEDYKRIAGKAAQSSYDVNTFRLVQQESKKALNIYKTFAVYSGQTVPPIPVETVPLFPFKQNV